MTTRTNMFDKTALHMSENIQKGRTMTTRTAHTPGPWLIEDGTFVYRLNNADINTFCLQVQGGYTDQGTRTTKDELSANARLIAAAPDLLSACYLAAVRLEGGSEAERNFNASIAKQLREAIAKAEGR